MNRFLAPLALVLAVTIAGAAMAAPKQLDAGKFFSELAQNGN